MKSFITQNFEGWLGHSEKVIFKKWLSSLSSDTKLTPQEILLQMEKIEFEQNVFRQNGTELCKDCFHQRIDSCGCEWSKTYFSHLLKQKNEYPTFPY